MAGSANRGLVVLLAGVGINLALGVLYTWSIFKGAIRDSIEKGGEGAFGWDLASLNDPYAVCCLVFAFTMIIAGKSQDLFGPRKTALAGGVLVGMGFVWISQTTDYLSWVLGFGLLGGAGIAFGYSSATPAALRWFAPNKTGIITGIVVSGFGLASVYIAPLSQYLITAYGIQKAMLIFGVAFLLVVSALAMLLFTPPPGYVPAGLFERRGDRKGRSQFKNKDAAPFEIIKSPMFWILWTLFFIGAGAGLMVIGNLAGMARSSMGENAFLAVAILAVGNAGGRICAGLLSDRIGRKRTLIAMFAFQAMLMFLSVPVTEPGASSPIVLVLIATFIGFNYGANLALFPSYTKDLWGMRNFGVNYGALFTSWGVGGLVMSRMSQTLMAESGSFRLSFITAGALLVIGMAVSLLIKDEKDELRRSIKRNAV